MTKKKSVVKKTAVKKTASKRVKPAKKGLSIFPKNKWMLWGLVTGVVVCLYFIFR